jgi:hypothetical protein
MYHLFVENFTASLDAVVRDVLGEDAKCEIDVFVCDIDPDNFVVKAVVAANNVPVFAVPLPDGFIRELGIRLPQQERIFILNIADESSTSVALAGLDAFEKHLRNSTATCTVLEQSDVMIVPGLIERKTGKFIYVYSQETGQWRKALHPAFETKTVYIETGEVIDPDCPESDEDVEA